MVISFFIIEAGRPSWPAGELFNCEITVITSSTVTSGSVIHSIHSTSQIVLDNSFFHPHVVWKVLGSEKVYNS